ncbi:hypothetical protein [Phytohabitans houttuyneae]|uniref:Uncharacterized protein n=1 Tax=Phytohabitans houttuyneae TaxID=1076126 RepID=A0A6V8K7J1_9ACTN|nr:hypothetical protein [Phytohabitans houttuyneae]GFJ77707.1 hypothetical protein Phou_018870 [Phytohabitans houttuyneae]
MAIPDEGGGSTTYDYESFGDRVNVEVTDLVTYWEEMTRLSGEATGAASNAMAEMQMMIHNALSTPLEGEILPEGQQAARFLTGRVTDFQRFIADVTTGITNIGNAAAVVAEMYEGSDNENGANLGDIGFVFGDYGARGPEGFRKTETFQEWQQRMAQESGMDAQALTGDERFATNTVSYPYGAIYTFGDGSRKQTYSGYESGPNGELVAVSTVYIYGPDGKLLSSTTERSFENSAGRQVNSTSTTSGEGDQRRQSTSTTTENADGSMTVSNQTQAGDSTPVTTETTVRRDSHQDDGVESPVSDAAEDLGSDGDQQTVHDYGMA